MSRKTINEINNLTNEEFEREFSNVIELYPQAAMAVKNKRPFRSVKDLCEAFGNYLDSSCENEKLKILKLHPDLAGGVASQGSLTEESAQEQVAAGLDQLTEEQQTTITKCNERYRFKFGFPFIICARANKVESIISGLQTRLDNSKEEEIITSIEEVKNICSLRIMEIVKDN